MHFGVPRWMTILLLVLVVVNTVILTQTILPSRVPPPSSSRAEGQLTATVAIAVITSPQTFGRLWAGVNTWFPRCKPESSFHIRVFIARDPDFNFAATVKQTKEHPFLQGRRLHAPDPSFITVLSVAEEANHHIANKTFYSLLWLYQNFPDADWYMKIDDDTYLFPHNLQVHLANYDPKEMLFLGRVLFPQGLRMASGGAGYLISHALMKQFVAVMPQCMASHIAEEDVRMAHCMNTLLNVTVTNFPALHPVLPRRVMNWRGWDPLNPAWYALRPVTFHGASDIEQFEVDYLLYEAHT